MRRSTRALSTRAREHVPKWLNYQLIGNTPTISADERRPTSSIAKHLIETKHPVNARDNFRSNRKLLSVANLRGYPNYLMEKHRASHDKSWDQFVIDDIIEYEVGPCGLWQWGLVILGVFSIVVTSNFPIFTDSQPKQRCYMGKKWEDAFSETGLDFNHIIKLTGGEETALGSTSHRAGCRQYEGDWFNSTVPASLDKNTTWLEINGFTNNTVPCVNGYVYQYDDYQYHGGVPAEFNLVCEKAGVIPVGTSLFMIGMITGYIVSGIWAGKFGRKNALICFSFCELISSGLCSLVHNYWLFSTLRIVVAIGSYAKLSLFNLILLELTVARYRSLFNAVYMLGFNSLSRAVLAFFAYFLSNWRWLNFAASAQGFLVFSYFFLVPESPRWLLSQNRPLDAVRVLQLGRRVNRLWASGAESSAVLDRLSQKFSEPKVEDVSKSTSHPEQPSAWKQFLKLFSSWYMIRTAVLSTLIFNCYSFSFIGLSLYTRMVHWSVFLVVLVNGIVALPGVVIAFLAYRVAHRRRLPLVLMFLLCSILLFIGGGYTYIRQPKEDVVMTVALNLGLMLYATLQSMLFIYVPELYPSDVRSQGFGIVCGLGRTGTFGATYANQLDVNVKHALPMLIYASVTLASGLFVLGLSDTTGEERTSGTAAPLERSNEDILSLVDIASVH
ncbi:unnamed protein product [Calicophoron daubneyi]|uniref:Major facilitator superfamily (MFS) profile domain-containing protein n=1 Tax=Calicophoron daubneyi TaxID=300641 RepID=A0AAV2T3R3_CALDB